MTARIDALQALVGSPRDGALLRFALGSALLEAGRHAEAVSALRAAVTGFAKTLSREVAADGVTVNTLGPGYTATERVKHLFEDNAARQNTTPEALEQRLLAQIPARRMARPEEIAAVAAFLVSEPASYLTGQAVMVDGGYTHGLL